MDFLAIGDKAPDFTLLNHEGEDVSFKDFSGKKLVICTHDVGDQPWFEIDNLQDLKEAERIFDALDGSTESEAVKF